VIDEYFQKIRKPFSISDTRDFEWLAIPFGNRSISKYHFSLLFAMAARKPEVRTLFFISCPVVQAHCCVTCRSCFNMAKAMHLIICWNSLRICKDASLQVWPYFILKNFYQLKFL